MQLAIVGDNDALARLHIAQTLKAQHIQRHRFRRNDVFIPRRTRALAQYQRANTVRVTDCLLYTSRCV